MSHLHSRNLLHLHLRLHQPSADPTVSSVFSLPQPHLLRHQFPYPNSSPTSQQLFTPSHPSRTHLLHLLRLSILLPLSFVPSLRLVMSLTHLFLVQTSTRPDPTSRHLQLHSTTPLSTTKTSRTITTYSLTHPIQMTPVHHRTTINSCLKHFLHSSPKHHLIPHFTSELSPFPFLIPVSQDLSLNYPLLLSPHRCSTYKPQLRCR